MPDPLTHFSVAFAITAPFIGIKRAALAGIVALLPDLDALTHIHRSATHSIITILAITIPIIIITKTKKPNHTKTILLYIIALLTHPILDTFQTYTPILYPLITESILISINAGIIIDNTLKPYINTIIQTTPTNFTPFTQLDAPLIMPETLLPALILIATPLLYTYKNQNNKKHITKITNIATQDPINLEIINEINTSTPDDITIVIPTLNEAEAIGKVIDELKQEGYKNILVVDGYSNDGTPEIARQKGAKVIYQHGKGKAGAIKTAIENITTPYMLIMDGDHTYDPKDIKKMLLHANKYDQIIGRRTNTENIPILHRLGNKIINSTFNLLLGTSLSDVCSGMYMLKTEKIKEAELKSIDFSIEVEIAAYMTNYGKITEVPINYRKRIGKEKIRTWKSGYSIFKTVFWLARTYNPVFLLSTIATLLLIPGMIITTWQLYLRYVYGAQAWSLGMAWLGLILIIIGIQGFTTATIALLLKRVEKRLLQKIETKTNKQDIKI
jgi:dolichol-phosphate mannosyltransferase